MSLLLLFSASSVVIPPVTPSTTPTIVYSHGTASPGESEVSICNLALSHLGHSVAIASLDERSTEAQACNLWYTRCRDELLRKFAWPFATVPATDLALVAYTPNGPEWTYTYSYPTDGLLLLRAPYGSTRNASPSTLTRFKQYRNPLGGSLLYMDQDAATIEFVRRVTDPEEFTPDFVIALSYLLASRICASVVSENASQRTLTMLGLYKQAVGEAKATAANEQAPDQAPESDFVLARE